MKSVVNFIVIFGLITLLKNLHKVTGMPGNEEDDIQLECEKELNITENYKSMEITDVTEETKCFVLCLLKKSGNIENGKIIMDKALKDMENDCEAPLKFNKSIAESILIDCTIKTNEDDDCDFALKYMICVLKEFASENGYCRE